MKKLTKISFGGILIIAIWIVIAQSCMQFKISDTETVKQFDKAGVPLTAITTRIGSRPVYILQSMFVSFNILNFQQAKLYYFEKIYCAD